MLSTGLCIRFVVFIGALSLFPRRMFPFSVSFGFVLCMGIFFAPFLFQELSETGSSGQTLALETILVQGPQQYFASPPKNKEQTLTQQAFLFAEQSFIPPWQEVLPEILFGLLMATTASLAGYVAQLFSRWISVMIFPDSFDRDELRGFERHSKTSETAFSTAIMLFFVTVLIGVSGFPKIFSFVGESLFIPIDHGFASGFDDGIMSTKILSKIIFPLGQASFTIAFLLFSTVFFASLTLDMLFLVGNRFFPGFLSTSFVLSARLPFLLFIVASSLYVAASEFSHLIDRSLHSSVLTTFGKYLGGGK